mmetsp:Transcript_102453/g.208580  ORF Transcript_102453/g.208580 Transcript_102453/m.208580 type:complete len:201 (-) Transcript_102453:1351-1953(-)
MHIVLEVVLQRDLLAEVMSLVVSFAVGAQLCEHRESVVGGLHATVLHLLQDAETAFPEMLACAPIQKGVPSNLVGPQFSVCAFLHVFHDFERLLDKVFLDVTLNDRAVCDHVRLDVLTSHLLQELLDTAHGETPGAHVDERIVCHNGELEFLCAHLLVYGPYTLKAFRVRKTLQHGAIDNGVKQGACLRVIENRLNELIA